MQACPYQYGAAPGASSVSDEVREAQDAIDEAKRQLRAKKAELKTVERNKERAAKDVERTVGGDYTETLFAHMDDRRNCSEYKDYAAPAPATNQGQGEETAAGGDEGGQQVASGQGQLTHDGFDINQWSNVCRPKGDVNKSYVCGNFRDTDSDSGDRRSRSRERAGRGSASTCVKGLTDYRKLTQKSQSLQVEIEDLEECSRR
jgi:hypothetical protein